MNFNSSSSKDLFRLYSIGLSINFKEEFTHYLSYLYVRDSSPKLILLLPQSTHDYTFWSVRFRSSRFSDRFY
jgi:hypothetical protein